MINKLLWNLGMRTETPDGAMYEEHADDFLLGTITDILDKIDKVSPPDDIRYHWNQYKHYWSSMFCTVVAPVSTCCSLFNVVLSDAERKECFDYAVKEYGYQAGVGNYVWKGVDAGRNRWNKKFPDKQVLSFKTTFGSDEMLEVLDKGFGVVVGYSGNSNYNRDYKNDNILNGTSFGARTYGHVTQMYRQGIVWDSSAGNTYSKYEVPPKNFKSLLNNGVYFPSAYVFLPTQEISKLPPEDVKMLMVILRMNKLIRERTNSTTRTQVVMDLTHKHNNDVRKLLPKEA